MGGKRGQRICEYGLTQIYYKGRHHVFVVGTDYAVWHIWQVRVGGPYSNWTTLGGVARSGVYLLDYGPLRASVVGTDSRWWCRTYNGSWSGCYRCSSWGRRLLGGARSARRGRRRWHSLADRAGR